MGTHAPPAPQGHRHSSRHESQVVRPSGGVGVCPASNPSRPCGMPPATSPPSPHLPMTSPRSGRWPASPSVHRRMWSTSTCPRSRTPPRRTRMPRQARCGDAGSPRRPGRRRRTGLHDLSDAVSPTGTATSATWPPSSGALGVVDEGPGRAGTRAHHAEGLHRPSRPDPRHRCQSLSPVWGLSLARGLTGIAAGSGEPVGRVDVEGVAHVVERVTDRCGWPPLPTWSPPMRCSSPTYTTAMAWRGCSATR